MSKPSFIQRFIPDRQRIQSNKYLKVFGKLLDNPHLWQMNRRSVARAFSVGLFITYLPFLGHMLLAAFCAILFRANLPISLALVWVVNPLTMIPMFGFAYMVGATLLGQSLGDLDFSSMAVFQDMWQPFVLGCFICGGVLAIIGNVMVRVLWRFYISKKWKQRALVNRKLPI